MRFQIAVAVAVLSASALPGCRQDNQDIKREIAELRQDIQGLRKPGESWTGSRGTPGAAPPDVRSQLARGGGGGGAQRQQPAGPDPAKVYAVGIDGAPVIGPATAALTVVMAYEYACPWCNRQREAFTAMREAYGDSIRFVYRPYVVHPDLAGESAYAACAGARQDRFAAVNDALWTKVFDKRAFDRASVEAAATSVPGIDAARLRSDMDGECKAWVARERTALAALGVNATPQVWINGRPIPAGYKPLEALRPVLDEELARARERIAAGTRPEDYYETWVLKKGLARVAAN